MPNEPEKIDLADLYKQVESNPFSTCRSTSFAVDFLPTRADRIIKQLRFIIPAALMDEPIREVDVHDWWDDEFLTNIVVPYLEHIRNMFESTLAPGNELSLAEAKENATSIVHLEAVIEECKDWRG